MRGQLNGKLAKLKQEIWEEYAEYGNYTVLDSRKAARHCRETMEAYRCLGGLELCDFDNEEKKVYSTHRRVFDSNTDILMLAADMPVSSRVQPEGSLRSCHIC